jgi:hypothetical protein
LTTCADGGWKTCQSYCETESSFCVKFTICPTSAAVNCEIGEFELTSYDSTYTAPVYLDSITSTTEIVVSFDSGINSGGNITDTIQVASDGNSFYAVDFDGTFTIGD